MVKKHSIIEVLFVENGSDGRGRRVLVREAGCENTIWTGNDMTEADVKLLGIADYREQIQSFLGRC